MPEGSALVAAAAEACVLEPLLAYCADGVALLRIELFKRTGAAGGVSGGRGRFDQGEYLYGAALRLVTA